MNVKVCSKCFKDKPLSEFGKKASGKNGIDSCCKECHRICSQKYRQTHKIEAVEYERKYYKTIVGCLRKRFRAIKQRCNNPNCPVYKNYGGRGIKVNFTSDEFVDYVINKLKIDPRKLMIDRIDNNGNYEPGNIRFVTIADSNRNKRTTMN